MLTESDLYQVVLPKLELLCDVEGSYLVGRIPPHLGHGVTRYVSAANAESVQQEMVWEARQDRSAAGSLLRALMAFVTDPTPNSMMYLLHCHSQCGEWRSWLAQSALPDAPLADAEQVLARTVGFMEAFQRFSSDYQLSFSAAVADRGRGRPWFERDMVEPHGGPPVLPLYAGIFEILAQDDLLRVIERQKKYGDQNS
jgi:hypothetical protein